MILGVCNALECAHDKSFVHRDVKPANIMQTESGEIKLLDLGLACFNGAQSGRPEIPVTTIGTPGYMSPEQREAPGNVDARADIYSLGCVFQYLLTGKLLDECPDTRISTIPQLTAVMDKMVAVDPQFRFQSVAELRVALLQLQATLDPSVTKARNYWYILWMAIAVLVMGAGMRFRSEIVLRLRNQAVIEISGQKPDDRVILETLTGEIKELDLDAKARFVVDAGEYRLRLKSLDNRSLDPSQVELTAGHNIRIQIREIREARPGVEGVKRVNLPSVSNSIGMSLIELPAGSFRMGGSDDDPLAGPEEFPQRLVTFSKPFLISQYEVTVGQFKSFVAATEYATESESAGDGGWRTNGRTSWGEKSQDVTWQAPGYATSDTHPVSVVSYADVEAFCAWLSEKEGQIYRLPTEAEWEYACRAGTTAPRFYPPESMPDFCWFRLNMSTIEARPVGRRQPNPWGLYDMNGNVREWCLDWYSPTVYQVPFKDQPEGPATGDKRVIRGGCFMDLNAFLRSSHRGFLDPHDSINNQGFRVVRELP